MTGNGLAASAAIELADAASIGPGHDDREWSGQISLASCSVGLQLGPVTMTGNGEAAQKGADDSQLLQLGPVTMTGNGCSAARYPVSSR